MGKSVRPVGYIHVNIPVVLFIHIRVLQNPATGGYRARCGRVYEVSRHVVSKYLNKNLSWRNELLNKPDAVLMGADLPHTRDVSDSHPWSSSQRTSQPCWGADGRPPWGMSTNIPGWWARQDLFWWQKPYHLLLLPLGPLSNYCSDPAVECLNPFQRMWWALLSQVTSFQSTDILSS